MHFVGSPSKFLARDPISDCFSSRRRRASPSTDTASLLVVRVRRGVPVHIVVQRARCTYLLFHYYYFSFAAAKYSNDTSFYKWAEKKMDYGEMPSEHFWWKRVWVWVETHTFEFCQNPNPKQGFVGSLDFLLENSNYQIFEVQTLCRCFRARLTVVQFYCPIVQMNDKWGINNRFVGI